MGSASSAGGRGAWLCRILEFDGGLGDVASKDVWGDGGPPRRDLSQFVCILVVLAPDMVEFQAVKLVFEAAHCVTICLHLRIVTTRLLHHLVDDELSVTAYVEALDAKIDGDAEATEEGLVLCHVRGRNVHPVEGCISCH